MKRNILFILTMLFGISILFTSCEEDTEGAFFDVGDSAHTAFASTLQKVEMLPTDNNQIMVPVYRGGNAGSEISVNVAYTSLNAVTEGVFELTNPNVHFPAGEHKSYAILAYSDINDLDAGATYEFELQLTNEGQLSVSEIGSIKVQAQRKLTFSHFATGTFTSEFFGASWTIVVEKAAEADVYRIPDCFIEGFPISFSVDQDNNITYSTQATGYEHPDYGMVSLAMPDIEEEDPYYIGEPFRDGNTFYLIGRFLVGAGSFGHWYEYLEIDEN